MPQPTTTEIARRAWRIPTKRTPRAIAPTGQRHGTISARLATLLRPPHPRSYIADDEQCLIATRRHWIAPLLTMARTARTMALAAALLAVLSYLAPTVALFQAAVAIAALGHTAFLGWSILRWRTDHLLVTDRRLLRISGIVTITVDSVPLTQITDTTCTQSLTGRILGYGTLRIQSAGQAPAIERLHYLPTPATLYRATLHHDHRAP
ncbi:MAG: PH domain-containing protein [Actinomycetota bacterium]|nr:PH domain-containing protein [Actinomycetota bacterium]